MPPSALRVLYVTASWDGPYRYRCRNAVAQLRDAGAVADVASIDDEALLGLVPHYSLVVLFRLPFGARVADVCAAARAAGARLAFECDDLIFDPSVEPLVHFLPDLPPAVRTEYRQRFTRLRATFDACDVFVGGTPALVRLAERLGKPAVLHPNLLGDGAVRQATAVRALARLHPRPPTLAYVSGSNTHDRDFETIVEPLVRVLSSVGDARLFVCGHLDLPLGLRRFGARIVRVPYLDWRVYPWALGGCRAALAPAAVVNEFTDAKSVLKFFEAGVLGVPVVATPSEPFRAAVEHGRTGLLAGTAAEWEQALREVLRPDRSRALGGAARRAVLAQHTTRAHRGRLARLLEPFAGTTRGEAPPPRSLEPPGPSDEVSLRADRVRQAWALLRDEPPPTAGHEPPAEPAWQEPVAPARFDALLSTLATYGARWIGDERPVVLDLGGAGPRLERADLDVTPADFRWLVVRMRAVTDHLLPAARFSWASEDVPTFEPERAVAWAIEADGRARTYAIDLGVTPWARAERVTRLRLELLDAPGEVGVEAVLLAADLAQLVPDGDLRGPLAERYLRGVGIECGALQKPLSTPSSAHVLYVDRLTPAQARAHYPELEGQPLVPPHVVGDVQRLPVGDARVDFCIGNHLLEHARDPIAAIEDLLRVVRPGGVLYVSVPDVGNPLDRGRPVTPFAHLLADHDAGADRRAEDAAHYREYTDSAHPQLDEATRRSVETRFLAQQYSIHFHTFDEAAFHRLLDHVTAAGGARLVEFVRNPGQDFDEHVAVLRRTNVVRHADAGAPVDVIVPIYNAREETIACVESVLRHADGDWRLVLVDDASRDTELVAWLDQLPAADPRVTLLRNEANRGFVETANRGMRHAGGRDVLLLNSDTVVTDGFLAGLRRAVYADATTGIVSPLSNNATICSVPAYPQGGPIPEGFDVDSFGALIARSSLRLRPEIPTAVGFCMYVRAEVLERVGLFDAERFPRGYGEENDLCERALAAGWRVRLVDDVFVYHAGEASFGEETRKLRTRNDETLEALHPGYFAKVARFIASNRLAAVHDNLRLSMRRTGRTDEPALLVLLHDTFEPAVGGTEHHVRDLLATLAMPRAVVAVPRSDGIHVTEVLDGELTDAPRYLFPLATPPERFDRARPDVESVLARIVALFGVGAVHVHHLLNWPTDLARTLGEVGLRWVVTAHDYYCVCPNPNLVDVDGTPCCVATNGSRPDPASCLRSLCAGLGLPPFADADATLAQHRADFAALLAGAQAVIFPSRAARDVVRRTHAVDDARALVIPHGAAPAVRRVEAREPRGVLRVALLGAVAYAIKGGDTYPRLVARTRDLPIEWHVFGDADGFGFAERLRHAGAGDRLVLHGRYARREITALLAEAGIDLVVLLPNWPETFSYTLSEALLAGIPVIASAQGALAERLAGSDASIVVADVDEAAAAIGRLAEDPAALARMQHAARSVEHRSLGDMAADYRPLYASMLAGAPRPAPLDLAARRELFVAADRAAHEPRETQPPAPVLSHYGRWWYPAYERVAALVPPTLRRWARARIAERQWPTVKTLRFDRRTATSGLDVLPANGGTHRFRARDRDPSFVFAPDPIPTRRARIVRFEMRTDASRGHLYAQLFWVHGAEEGFSEEKSVHIPVDATDGAWHEYTLRLDDTDRGALWDAGETISRLRFDPLNAPGVIELRDLRLCAAGR